MDTSETVDDGGAAADDGAAERTARRPPAVMLRSLAPRYDPAEHEVYVTALQRALDGSDPIRNIALTGPYGTGKSSVLVELARRYEQRVIELSLSSVGEEPDPRSVDASVTNRIQKEIVKQILYRDPPARTRGSRFRRLSGFRWGRESVQAVVIGLLLLGLLWLTTWSRPLVAVAGAELLPVLGAYLLLWVLLSAAVLLLRWWTFGQLSLEKLTAGPATVSLTGAPTSYFDQYIDEIVYYFEQTGRDVVIFEDLDRFRDVHIFESLRALNTLLNSAEQVRPARPRRRGADASSQPRREVVFIYALRDSVFERLGQSADREEGGVVEQEGLLANRTKFFDLVVPVVPFISHRNARDLMGEQMEGTGVGVELISLAAQHVADQRLIIDLRNEFDVYADRLLFGRQVTPGLTADKLFAMLLYKSVNLRDFEQIRFRRSRLDRLWEQWRDLVAASTDASIAADAAALVAMGRPAAAARHARELADRVDAIALTITNAQTRDQYFVQQAGQQRQSSEVLREPSFWRELVAARANLTVYSPLGGGEVWAFPQIAARLDRPLSPELWRPEDRDHQLAVRKQAATDQAFLAHHRWDELLRRPKFTLPGPDGTSEPFSAVLQRLFADSPLSRALITAGYVDEHFGLYVSIFYGRIVSATALDFMLHVLDRGRADIDFRLMPADVDAILTERGATVLDDPALRNVDVLDRLLELSDDEAGSMLQALTRWGPSEVRFATRFLGRARNGHAFVVQLAETVPGLVGLLATAPVGDARIALVDQALISGSWPEDDTAELRQFVLEHYRDFPSLTGEVPDDGLTSMEQIAASGLELPEVADLNRQALGVLSEQGGYRVTEANLLAVTGLQSVGLDRLRREHPSVARFVGTRLPDYLSMISGSEGRQHAVEDALADTLRWVADVSDEPELVEAVVGLAEARCRVEALGDAPPAAWGVLLMSGRTPVTAANLSTWLTEFPSLQQLDPLLTDLQSVPVEAGLAETDRQQIAVALLRTTLPVTRRVQLAASLRPEEWLPVEQITPEPDRLTALLLEADLVPDDAETFQRLLPDWSSRRAAIAVSSMFPTFVSVKTLPPSQVQAFFDDDSLPAGAKEAVLLRLPEWLGHASRAAFTAAARWARRSGRILSEEELTTLVEGGAAAGAVLPLVAAAPSVPVDGVRAMLRALGGDYAVIADRGTRSPVLPDDGPHQVVLERLREAGVVSKFKPIVRGLRVSLRRP